MAIQIIVYSIATGRVRRVVDPQEDVPSAIAFLAQVRITTGEACIVYNKQGNGLDTLLAWQAAVTAVTGITPAADRYVVVDTSGNIIAAILADVACGDSLSGYTLVQSDTMNIGGTYIGGLYTPPVEPIGLSRT